MAQEPKSKIEEVIPVIDEAVVDRRFPNGETEASQGVSLPDPVSDRRTRSGFDAARKCREDDYLGRWPFAREIYSIATGGPDWSVRIGVYGEWGSGKTSVLEFVDSMGNDDDQVVIWFNPWQYSSKNELWGAFVAEVFSHPDLANTEGAKWAKTKRVLDRGLRAGQTVLQGGVELANDKAGKLVGGGLDLVKHFFASDADDLKSLRQTLGDKRVMILIDDLDRTNRELVPEILFALKEIMDTPGFAFICAFDPRKVGQVLRDHHPGFGEEFLEKIIDYPRWLPPATVDGLTKLAIADSKQFCDYVPEEPLCDVIPLLPRNPRAIRQFIRLLALLKPQIARHYERELHWPTILAANVLRIRYPRIAHELLTDEEFWNRIDVTPLMARDGEEKAEITKQIEEHIADTAKRVGLQLAQPERDEIKGALDKICSQLDRWAFRTSTFLIDQMQIGEARHAVTWKEYDEFFEQWRAGGNREIAENWIRTHAQVSDRERGRVCAEIFEAAAVSYEKALREADGAFLESKQNPAAEKAESLLALLGCLLFELGGLDSDTKFIGSKELDRLFETVSGFVGSTSPVQARFSARNENILVQLVERWSGDLILLLNAIHPFDPFSFTHYEGGNIRALHKKLSGLLLTKFARQIIVRLREPGFADRILNGDSREYYTQRVILERDSVLWKELRSETLRTLAGATENIAIQENAYEILHWFQYKLQNEGGSDGAQILNLISDEEICVALWRAATASQLGLSPIARLRAFPVYAQKQGVSLEMPQWWLQALERISKPAQTEQTGENNQGDVVDEDNKKQ